jgi:Ca2+-binding EF-hand superfamily protein
MVNEHTAKSYRETYSVLRAFGLEPKGAADLYNELDTSGNGNIDQKELLKAYKDNPGLSYILERIWNSREYTDSWDDVT